ncbi:VCBS repeat-containing protein [Novosphingobium sp. G106]|uniref:FG-GAP-like repeat-containing protein n=1 Tax=Novosphingobium sp. G106 TaxID=2849500 RepID=UPI001C2CD35D|nr:FG-GAP-like repeat-containing protein [Novosphingobium sp. G106]MBV1691747.1 VCBS repeat-containing protein [Novosphingobium sp. G106]
MRGDNRLTGAGGNDTLTGGGGNDVFTDTAAGLSGDTITDFSFGDRIRVSNANITGFNFSLTGSTLNYTGGSLTLQNLPTGFHLTAFASAAGGVELTLAQDGSNATAGWGVEQPDGAIKGLATGAANDTVFAPNGHTLYVSRGGTLTAYDAVSGATTGSWVLGTKLGGMDISADGHYLVATEMAVGPANGSVVETYVYRLNLTTGTSTTYTTTGDSYFFDASFLPNGKVLLTQNYPGSGWEPVTTLDFAAGTFTRGAQIFAQNGTLTATPNKSEILHLPSNISDAPLFIHDASGAVIASHQNYADNVMGYNFGVQAISPSGSLVVQGVGLNVYDGSLHYITSLYDRYFLNSAVTGLAFSPDGSKLYVLDSTSQEVFALNTSDWSPAGGYPVGAAVSSTGQSFGDALVVSSDGRYLSVSGAAGVQIIDLSLAVSNGGTNANDTLVGDSANNTIYGFDGDDTINGKAGDDTMIGGRGNDTYIVDSTSDVIVERPNEGIDNVLVTVDGYFLPAAVENMILGGNVVSGYGNELANVLTGNALANLLFGSDGNDVLTGKDGNDDLIGGNGNDVFEDTAAGLNGDTIEDLLVGDKIHITDASLAGFAFALSGSTLTYTGGSLTLQAALPDHYHLVASAAGGGGVDLTLAADLPSYTNNGLSGDFNGDGRDDLVWRHDNGAFTDWLGQKSGGFVSNDANAFANLPTSWHVAGAGDFNGDGRDDLVWRNDNGSFTSWLGQPNGGFVSNDANAWNNVPTSWHVAGTGDFNGDGRDDLVWRNDNGSFTSWLGQPNGGFVSNDANAWNNVPTSWHVAGTGDFNGDGRDDLIWRNDNGSFTEWLGQKSGGFTSNDANAWNTVPTAWHVVGTGDFNGDGRDDIVWRNDNGAFTEWLGQSSGGFASNDANAWAVLPASWKVAGTGDYNGDGRTDITWRNDNGASTDWLALPTGGFVSNDANAWNVLPNEWKVQIADTTFA